MKILALDDEPGALRLLKRAILAVEPEADIVDFGAPQEAIDYVRDYEVDVAFLDIQMPGISGTAVAEKMQEYRPKINIIFTTGYSEYAVEAMKLRSSGYLMKPVTREDVQNELKNLRNPVGGALTSGKKVWIKTFGSFDLFVDDKVLPFRRERAKEVLAYLVDRRGSLISRKEISAVLFEDQEYTRATQTYLTQIIQSLKKALEDAGIPEILVVEYNGYAVDTKKFSCDSYDFLDGKPEAKKLYRGEYLSNYSWAEDRWYQFEE